MTGDPNSAFPTFCHISEYGAPGYRELHTLLAISQPLNLWAPSSVLIRHASCIPAKDFIRYVEEGVIRIQARERWLTDRAHRQTHPWEEARWDNQIDNALRDILRIDERLPERERRVLAAPPENGLELATERLESDPGQIAYWNRAYNGRRADRRIPEGTFATVQRYADGGPFAIAKWILRDAYNHGAAFALSGARAPLLLNAADRHFVRMITHARTTESADARPPAPTTPSRDRAAALAEQLLEVLRCLDIHAGPRSLDAFLTGPGRRELVQWISETCDQYQYHPRRVLDGLVIRELHRVLEPSRFKSPIRELRERPVATIFGTLALATGALSYILSPGDPLNAVGLAAGAFPLGTGLVKQMGWVPSTYDGPQWPFLYAYSSRATKSKMTKMAYALSVNRGGEDRQ